MPSASAPLARHDLAWLASDAAAAARLVGVATISAQRARALLDHWIGHGHPLIVTRQGSTAGDEIALGLALPPAWGRARMVFLVPRRCLRETRRPPLLAECAPQLPAGWQPKIGALAASPEIAAASPRVYGSAAIEIVTAEPCLTPTSDLDLLLAPSNWSHVVSVAAALAALDLSLPEPRLDGEIVNPEGVAVAWRELATRRQRVLMKSHARVGLDSTAAFGRGFAACERAA